MAEGELPKPDELHEHAASSFSRRVALVTAIYAVALAIAALGGNHAVKEMLLPRAEDAAREALQRREEGHREGHRDVVGVPSWSARA
ncbi:MAG TPA: hypothetical protein VFR53_04515 [Methylomirabilota bacterium]|nr:hypothetical protein [Methylomirabilota bacterium]